MGSHLTIQQLIHRFHLRLLGWEAMGSVPDFMTSPIFTTETQRHREVIHRFHRFAQIFRSNTTVPACIKFLRRPILPHLWKSVKSVDKKPWSPCFCGGPWGHWGNGVTSHNSTIDPLLSFEIARLGRFATAVHERKGVSS